MNARAIIERPAQQGNEILLQVRDKPGQARALELPGGQVEPFESLIDTLVREVAEETGLTVVEIEHQPLRVVTDDGRTRVECVRPFAAYQTLEGPVDSVGVYFRCRAEGRLVSHGDAADQPRWTGVAEVRRMLEVDPAAFSWVDRAGLTFYLDSVT